MILTDGEALVLTPSYHVFEMNKGHQDARAFGWPWAGAARGRPGRRWPPSPRRPAAARRVFVSLTNLDADGPVEVVLDLRGGSVGTPVGR